MDGRRTEYRVRVWHRVVMLLWVLMGLVPCRAADQMVWVDDPTQAFQMAAARGQLVMLHFTADNCPPCRRLEQAVFTQRIFAHGVSADYVPVRLNVAHHPDLARRYSIESWPTDVLVTPSGTEIHRMVSPQDADEYLRRLRQVAWHHRSQAQGESLAGFTPTARPEARQRESRGDDAAVSGPQVVSGQRVVQAAAVRQAAMGPVTTVSAGYSGVEIQNPFVGTSPAAPSPVSREQESIYSRPAAEQIVRASSIPSAPVPNATIVAAPPSTWSGPPSGPAAPPTVGVPMAGGPSIGPPIAQSDPPPTMNRTFSPQPPSNIQPTSVSTEETLGVEGYCVVAVMEQDRWVPGDTRWGVRHRGRLYLFHDAASQQRFLSDPDRYSPALAGYDPVVFSERGAYSPGVREHGVRYNDRMYLFESETNLLRFSQQPDRYAESVQRAMGLSAP